MRRLSFFAALVVIAGCAANVEDAEDVENAESTESAASAGPPTANVDASDGSELRVRAGGLTVWATAEAKPTFGVAEPRITVRLRTSRNLANAMSYVPEDGLGNARLVSARVVEIDLVGAHEIHTILGGAPFFVHLDTASGSPSQYDVRLELGISLGDFAGSPNAIADAGVRPVWVKDGVTNLRYRGRVRATGPTGATSMAATIAGKHATLLPLGNRAFRYDFTPERFIGGSSVLFRTTIRSTRYEKTANVALGVARLGLTKEGAVTAWPEPACKPSVLACVEDAGAAATDLGHCGTYREVTRCLAAE
jgi:hypothetical protein